MKYLVGRKWFRVPGTCSDASCPIAVQDRAIWCDEHLSQFRERLARSVGTDERRRAEARAYISAWLERMTARERGENQ